MGKFSMTAIDQPPSSSLEIVSEDDDCVWSWSF